MDETGKIVSLQNGKAGPVRPKAPRADTSDPRLVELVRLLARQAANAYFDAATAKRKEPGTN
jgi:hypothetical protein